MNIVPFEHELDEIEVLLRCVLVSHQQTLHVQEGGQKISGGQLNSVVVAVAAIFPGFAVTMLMVGGQMMSSLQIWKEEGWATLD